MKAIRLLWLLGSAALVSCTSDGGVTGSGISSISGNVILVRPELAALAGVDGAVELPFPIRVTIDESPDTASTTDDQGNFELLGDFSGSLTLRFANAEDDAELGPFPLDVPAGSTTLLQDIEIELSQPLAQRVQPARVRQFDFFGRVAMTDCDDDGTGILLVDDARERQFLVRLLLDTQIVRGDGRPLDCQDIRVGQRVDIQSVLRDDRTIAALSVVVAPASRVAPPEPVRNVELAGRVVQIDCEFGALVVEGVRAGESFRQRVRLSRTTEIRCVDQEPALCECRDIRPGDDVVVQGILRTNSPGVIDAGTVLVEA